MPRLISPTSRGALFSVYATVFLDLLGFGIILPHLPFFAGRLGATGIWVGALMSAYSVAQFIGAPVLGRLSDRFGRRPVLLGSLAGSAVSMVITGSASTLSTLLVARALAGAFGGSIGAAQAYIADVSRPDERARFMGLLGASIGLGFVFGPALGAVLGKQGFSLAAYVAAGLAAANFLLAFFVLPESRPAKGRGRVALDVGSFSAALGRPGVVSLIVAGFVVTLGFVGMEATFALLAARRMGIGEVGVGWVFTLIGALMVIVQGGLIGPLTRRYGERRLAIAGGLFVAGGLGLLPFVPGLGLGLLAVGILSSGQGLLQPSMSTLLSRFSRGEEQGGILGIGQGASAAARAVGPILGGWLWDRSFQLPYVLASVLTLAAVVLVGTLGPPPVD